MKIKHQLISSVFLTFLTITSASMHSTFLNILNGHAITSIEDALPLLPVNDIPTMQKRVEESIEAAEKLKRTLLAVPPTERTYENTIQAYDTLCALIGTAASSAQLASAVSADTDNRTKPYEYCQKKALEIASDKAFYEAFCEYQTYGATREKMNEEQRYFFDEAMKDFVRSGYAKSNDEFAQITLIKEKIAQAESTFNNLINNDASSIFVTKEDLEGVSESFIAAQKRAPNGAIELFCNTPTISAVMPHCHSTRVRKELHKAFNSRAYPGNVEPLQSILSLREELATMLGYPDYASYSLATTIVGTPEKAHAFIETMANAAREIEQKDVEALLSTLPSEVLLTEKGELQPWDVAYASATYKKKKLDLDPRVIAEYFPVEKTIEGIFAIYEQFMNVTFAYTKNIPGAWHEQVSAITVYTKDRSKILGFIFMDLFPRPQKYSHACCGSVIPRTQRQSTTHSAIETPYVGFVIANFPEPRNDAPSLLLHADVTTFFHEFGHAMHGVLSCTEHACTSGTRVLSDFVELPSQILEEWMYNKEMIRLVSSHYKTGQPLPDDRIDTIREARAFGRGLQEATQNFYGLLSLNLHQLKNPINLDDALRQAHTATINKRALDPENRMYASFGHLTGYGPTYYGYALSRAYAYDVFKRIEEAGLLDSAIGAQFVECILKPGGSRHPAELLNTFLGRPASADAYLTSLTKSKA